MSLPKTILIIHDICKKTNTDSHPHCYNQPSTLGYTNINVKHLDQIEIAPEGENGNTKIH